MRSTVVAAANPPDQAADGWELSPPLANRFCHLDWPVDARTLADGFAGGWPTPSPPEPARRLGTADPGRSKLDRRIRHGPPRARSPGPRGRSRSRPRLAEPANVWDLAARLQAAAEGAGANELSVSLLVRGCVGAGAGVEYLTWLEEADLPDPEAVLASPDEFVLPERGDRAYAALSSVAAAVAADPTPDRWNRGWRAFGRAAGSVPDVAAAAAVTLARSRPDGAPIPEEVKLFAPLLRDAGLLA